MSLRTSEINIIINNPVCLITDCFKKYFLMKFTKPFQMALIGGQDLCYIFQNNKAYATY